LFAFLVNNISTINKLTILYLLTSAHLLVQYRLLFAFNTAERFTRSSADMSLDGFIAALLAA
jgi:hypothetical protein